MSTFSGDIGPEEEDGGGWGGLVPDRSEESQSRLAKIAAKSCQAPSASDIAKEAARLSEASLQEHAMHLGAIGMAGINQPIWETRAKLVRYLEEKVLTEHASIIQSAISRAVEEARKREQDFLRPGNAERTEP